MNPISIRLLNQQLIAPQFSKPEEVVSHFGAMQDVWETIEVERINVVMECQRLVFKVSCLDRTTHGYGIWSKGINRSNLTLLTKIR